MKAYVSIFSGGGIGDIGFRKAGLTPIVLNELDEDRSQIAQANFPEAVVVQGDINKKIEEIKNICQQRLKELNVKELFLLSATPPCQGMSKNGIGSILKAMKEGKRPKVDERNYLFKAALELLSELNPIYFFFENVDRMFNTYIVNDDNISVKLVDYFLQKLNDLGYIGDFRLLNFADYGLPQNRRRAVGIFRRKDTISENFNINSLFPDPTHSSNPNIFQKPYLTVADAIGHLPPLDSSNKDDAESNYHPLHKVPVSRPELYYWIKHTQEGDTAYNNNKCPNCSTYSDQQDIFCKQCNTLLPKPTVQEGGEIRIIKGFISAYKRMKSYEPAPTITTRSAYACSDHNLHPTQNRVLSIFEVAVLQGINPFEFKWGPIEKINKRGKKIVRDIATDGVLRDILGEPVSPVFSEKVGRQIINLKLNKKEEAFS